MKVILTDNVQSLGNIGEIVNVSPGHARNFLFPKGLAKFADERNRKALENQKRSLTKKIEEKRGQALQVKEKLDDLEIEFVKKVGANGKLFGIVTSGEISKELASKEINIERRLLTIKNPIKTTGTFDVEAKIFQDITSSFKVTVKMSAKQLEELRKKSQTKTQDKTEKEAEAQAETKAETKDETKVETGIENEVETE